MFITRLYGSGLPWSGACGLFSTYLTRSATLLSSHKNMARRRGSALQSMPKGETKDACFRCVPVPSDRASCYNPISQITDRPDAI